MAMALAVDVPVDRPSSPSDPAPVSTAAAPFKAALPQPIPLLVSIPQTSDTANMAAAINPTRQLPGPHHVPQPPLPIPDFVFPARSANSAPSSFSRRGRRPMSVADLQERTTTPRNDGGISSLSPSPALPDFVFNPGASLPPTPAHSFLTPLQSPQSPRAIPARHPGVGHRRGGSEFVGGSLRSGDAFTLMSTSPTKSESGLASPKLLPTPSGPPHGRRGHAHRRSAAISSHDLSDILQPPNANASSVRGNSAPSSPSDFSLAEKNTFTFPGPTSANLAETAPTPDEDFAAMMDVDEEAEKPTVPAPSLPAGEERQLPSMSKPSNRARVGFSDTLEFIPRPLSLISSDTSSTVTARPATGTGSGGHSVSGSISSIISLNASVSAGAERETLSPLVRSPTRNTTTDSRPSTAGAVLDRTQTISTEDDDGMSPRRRNSIPILSTISPNPPDASPPESAHSLPSPSKTPKRWSFFSLDPFTSGSNTSPTRGSSLTHCYNAEDPTPATEEGGISPAMVSLERSGNDTVANRVDQARDDSPSASKSVGRKSSKKKKKAKSWSILTRKSKPRRKSRRTPTPPPVLHQAESDDDSMDTPMDYPAGMGELKEGLAVPPAASVSPSGSAADPRLSVPSFNTWELLPPPKVAVPDEDTSFPMIDLDAALGPFNTPLPRNPEWEAAQEAGGMSKRQLHSAAGMSRFNGPGMHYSHRRAESAPEMPPFNRAGIPRFSSSTAMADVFEEEEEEDEPKVASSLPNQTQKLPLADSKPASTHSASTTNTPPRSPADAAGERPPSIDIRVTSSEGNDGCSFDRQMNVSASASDEALSSARSRRGSGLSGLSGLSDDDKTQASLGLKSQYSASSLQDDVIVEEGSDGIAFGKSGFDAEKDTSSDSTVNPPTPAMRGRDLAPVDVSPMHIPAPSVASVSPYSMTPSSIVTSPRSPLSYEGNRVSTAPSSVADDNFRSLLMGEPGPEVRRSSDIPSLTSSNSTMTRESGAAYSTLGGQPRPYIASRGADRPASFTATAFGRRRSSLASLHRLVSTSHGERSKLSMEVQLDGAGAINGSDCDPEKRAVKVSRTKRISRMVQFWKAKEETSS